MSTAPVVLVEPVTPLGRELRRQLAALESPIDISLQSLDAGVGTLTEVDGEPALVQPLDPEVIARARAVAWCGEAEGLGRLVSRLPADAPALVDLSGSLALAEGVGLALGRPEPGRGPRRWRAASLVTALIAAPLRPLVRDGGVLRAEVVLLEPAGTLGETGIDALHRQTVAALNFEPASPEPFGARLAFDALPAPRERQRAEARRFVEELRVALGADAPAVSLVVVRVPVFLGTAAIVGLELADELDGEALREALDGAPGVRLEAEPVSPAAAGEQAGRGEVRTSLLADPRAGRASLWLSGDALALGPAGSAARLIAAL